MDPRDELARIIRTARAECGLKQEAFAREVGIVAAHLSRLEHGTGLPSIQLIHRISDRFGTDRSRMMRLLRRIKGFEDVSADGFLREEVPALTNGGAREKPDATGPRRGSRQAPVFREDDDALRRWLVALENGGPPAGTKIERTAPVTRAMSRDHSAFWLEVDSHLQTLKISSGDLLLVEPSIRPAAGEPSIVWMGDELLIGCWRDGHENGEGAILEVCNGTRRPVAVPRDRVELSRRHSYRIAGVRPRFQPLT